MEIVPKDSCKDLLEGVFTLLKTRARSRDKSGINGCNVQYKSFIELP